MICKKCGTENEKSAANCINCGVRLSSSKGFGKDVIECSASSFVMLVFSIIAVVCLIMPNSFLFEYIAIVREPLTGADKLSVNYIRNNQTLSHEKEYLDKMIGCDEPVINYIKFDYNGAIKALTNLRDSGSKEDKSKINDNIAELQELKKAVDEKQAELTALQNEYDVRMQEMKDLGASADKINSDNALNKIGRNLSVASRKKIEKENELNDRVSEIILSYNSIYAGALGGVVHEHNYDFKPFLNAFSFVITIMLIISFLLTIIVWFTKFYIARLVTAISNIVLTFLSISVPLVVWTVEYKWDLSVKNWIIYGVKADIGFALVLLCSIATLLTGVAYISSQMIKSK